MPSQKLIDYLKEGLQKGVVLESLKNALSSAGWSKEEIEEAEKFITGRPVAQPVPTLPTQPTSPSQPVPPAQISNYQISRETKKPKSYLPPIILGIIILIGAGIGIYFWLKPAPPPEFICGDGVCSETEKNQALCSLDCEKKPGITPCPTDYKPVCGKNNVTYQNLCALKRNDGELAYEGECKKITQTTSPSQAPTGAVGLQTYQCPGCSSSQSHAWEIKSDHTLYYDNQPYIPYITLSNMKYLAPAQEQLQEYQEKINTYAPKGINEFWFWFGFGKEEPQFTMYKFFDELTNTVIQNGGTYTIQVFDNEYLHFKIIQSTLQAKDKAPFYVRGVIDATQYAGQTATIPKQEVSFAKTKLDLTGIVYGGNLEDYFETTGISFQNEVDVYLADLGSNTYQSLPSAVASSSYDDASAKVTVAFNQITFPQSSSLKLVILPKIYATQLKSGGGALPLYYSDKILQATKGFYKKYAGAVAKKELRAVNINNEIDKIEENFCFFKNEKCNRPGQEGGALGIEFPDFSYDETNYGNWLSSKYSAIASFNSEFGTNYASFNEVKWFKPIVFDETKLLGIFPTKTRALAFEKLQRDYFTYKLGKGVGGVAKIIKEEWGDIPVCIASTDSADLDIEETAMEAGVDGLCAHYYGSLTGQGTGNWGIKTRTDFKNALNILNKQKTNKFYWVTEFNEIQQFEVGGQPSRFQKFASKEDMKTFMKILIDNGVKGFLFFENIGPPPSRAALDQLWGWYAELKDEMIQYVKSK